MTLPTSSALTDHRTYASLRRAVRAMTALWVKVGRLKRRDRRGATPLRPGEGGYTLTEIMIALAIVSMMLGGAAVMAFNQLEKARKKETIIMMAEVRKAVDNWRLDSNEQCPASLQQLSSGPNKILNKEPKDGWGRQFVFKCPGEHDTDGVDLLSFGKDGKEGTPDDLKSWEDDK